MGTLHIDRFGCISLIQPWPLAFTLPQGLPLPCWSTLMLCRKGGNWLWFEGTKGKEHRFDSVGIIVLTNTPLTLRRASCMSFLLNPISQSALRYTS